MIMSNIYSYEGILFILFWPIYVSAFMTTLTPSLTSSSSSVSDMSDADTISSMEDGELLSLLGEENKLLEEFEVPIIPCTVQLTAENPDDNCSTSINQVDS